MRRVDGEVGGGAWFWGGSGRRAGVGVSGGGGQTACAWRPRGGVCSRRARTARRRPRAATAARAARARPKRGLPLSGSERAAAGCCKLRVWRRALGRTHCNSASGTRGEPSKGHGRVVIRS